MPYPIRTEVLPLLNGSQANPIRGAKSVLFTSTTYLPKGEGVGVQLKAAGPVVKFCELTMTPLHQLPVGTPAATTRAPAPVTCGASDAFQRLGSKFDRRPFLSHGAPKYE